MAYRNDQTSTAIRDIRDFLAQQPVRNAVIGREAAIGRAAETEADIKAQDYKMMLPQKQLVADEAKRTMDAYNTPVNIRSFTESLTPDQGVMVLQGQKYGVPGIQQFEHNISQLPGKYKVLRGGENDGMIVDQNGNPLTERDADRVNYEWRRMMFLNSDPVKARDMQVAMISDALKSGRLSPEEAAPAQRRLQELQGMSEQDLLRSHLDNLLQIQARDAQYGRPGGRLLAPQIVSVQSRLDSLAKAAETQADRDHEIALERMRQRGADRRSRGGEPGPTYHNKQATEFLYGQLEEVNKAMRQGGRTNEETGEFVPFTPEEMQGLTMQANEIQEQISALSQGQTPQSPYGRVEMTEDGGFLVDRIPGKPQNGRVVINGQEYMVEEVRPPLAKAHGKPEIPQEASPEMSPAHGPSEMPTEAVDEMFKLGNMTVGRGKYGYMVQKNGQWARPTPEEEAQIKRQMLTQGFSGRGWNPTTKYKSSVSDAAKAGGAGR